MRVEVDVRDGLPMVDVVGLPDAAVRESRERVRTALRNSGFPFPVAQIIGYSLGLCNSLVLNKRWTFAQREPMTRRQLACFLAVNLAALAVSTGILVLTQERMQMNRYIGKAVSVVGSMAVNFVGNKLLVFREQRG